MLAQYHNIMPFFENSDSKSSLETSDVFLENSGMFLYNCGICPRRGPLHSLSEQQLQLQLKQIRNIVRFFSRISGGPGDGPQIVRFFPGFPEVQGMVRKL